MASPPALGPGVSDLPCGIVGAGRLARHLTHYLRESGVPVRSWSRATGGRLADALGEAPVVLVLITDDAIEPFLAAHPGLRSRFLIHCSGSLVTAAAHGMHPLMTFGPELYGLAMYWAVPFVCDAGGPLFREVFPTLPNPSFSLDPARKPLYHALTDLAGNLTPALWERLFLTFERVLGLPRDTATLYFKRVVDVCEGPSPFPRTGPIARGDRRTVLRNLRALGNDPIAAVYRGFVLAAAPELLEGEPEAGPGDAPGGGR
jgi:predicted short-subunit dehydrogenase-like oxidoreductase (DUF2520 family)